MSALPKFLLYQQASVLPTWSILILILYKVHYRCNGNERSTKHVSSGMQEHCVHSLCSDPGKCNSWSPMLALWEQATNFTELPSRLRKAVFCLCYISHCYHYFFRTGICFLGFDMVLPLNTTFIAQKKKKILSWSIHGLWRKQVCLESMYRNCFSGGCRKWYQKEWVWFFLKYCSHRCE